MSKVKVTVTNSNGRESYRRFQLRLETWENQEKGNTIRFLETQIPRGTKK